MLFSLPAWLPLPLAAVGTLACSVLCAPLAERASGNDQLTAVASRNSLWQHAFAAHVWSSSLAPRVVWLDPLLPPPSRRPPHHSHSSRQCRPVQSKKAVNHVAGREGNPPTPQPVVRRPDGGRRRPLPSMLRKRPNTNKQGGPHKTRQGPRPLRKADDHPILPPRETTQDVGRTYRWVPCDIPASQPPTPPRAQHADPRNQRAAPQPVDPLRRPQRPGVDAYFRTVGGHDNSPTSSPPPT